MQVWRVRTGQCLRRFDSAHGQGVTSLAFSRDGTHVLSASYDTLVRCGHSWQGADRQCKDAGVGQRLVASSAGHPGAAARVVGTGFGPAELCPS